MDGSKEIRSQVCLTSFRMKQSIIIYQRANSEFMVPRVQQLHESWLVSGTSLELRLNIDSNIV